MPLYYGKAILWDHPEYGLQITWANEKAWATDVLDDGVHNTDVRKEGEVGRLIYPGRDTPETEDEFLNRMAATAVPEGTPYRFEDGATVIAWNEKYREFRRDGCCKSDLKVDMKKAPDIWRNKMRRHRAPVMLALDREYQRADEDSDAQRKGDVVRRKKTLRDCPADPRIDAAKTPDELMALWPEELNDTASP
jgi:hypothetical protein